MLLAGCRSLEVEVVETGVCVCVWGVGVMGGMAQGVTARGKPAQCHPASRPTATPQGGEQPNESERETVCVCVCCPCGRFLRASTLQLWHLSLLPYCKAAVCVCNYKGAWITKHQPFACNFLDF